MTACGPGRAWLILVALACRSAQPEPDASAAGREGAPPAPAARVEASSIAGEGIPVIEIGRGDTILLLATIHGDESGGTPLLEELLRRLESGDVRVPPDRALVVVPVVNPDGLARRRRTNANGVDLNRNFPARDFHPGRRTGPHALSEPESRLVAELIREREPRLILSFHEPLGCIDYDGPARALARDLADVSPLPVERLGTRPGSLGSWAGADLGIPTVTVELPRGSGRLGRDALWERYGALVERALRD